MRWSNLMMFKISKQVYILTSEAEYYSNVMPGYIDQIHFLYVRVNAGLHTIRNLKLRFVITATIIGVHYCKIRKGYWAHMSISPRSGARGLITIPVHYNISNMAIVQRGGIRSEWWPGTEWYLVRVVRGYPDAPTDFFVGNLILNNFYLKHFLL